MLQGGLFTEMRMKLVLTFEVSPSFITKPSPGTEDNLLNSYHQLKDVKTQRRTRYFTASCNDTNTKKKFLKKSKNPAKKTPNSHNCHEVSQQTYEKHTQQKNCSYLPVYMKKIHNTNPSDTQDCSLCFR